MGYFTLSGADPASGYAVIGVINQATGNTTGLTWIGPTGGYYEVRDIAVQPAAVALAIQPAALAATLGLAPNPAQSSISLHFDLPQAAHVALLITDALGRPIGQLDGGPRPAGPQAITWVRQGEPAGVYFFSLRLNGQPAGTRRGVLTD